MPSCQGGGHLIAAHPSAMWQLNASEPLCYLSHCRWPACFSWEVSEKSRTRLTNEKATCLKAEAQGKANSDQISWRVGFYAATEHRLGSLISWGDFIFNIGRVSFQNHSTNTYLKQKLEQALSKNVISECLDIFHFNYTLFKLHCAVFWCESMTSSQKEGNKWQNQLLIK